MKTNALKLSLPLRVLSALLLLLTMSLWSCELFDKDKDPEPKPVPVIDEKPEPQNPGPQNPNPNPNSNPDPQNPGPGQNPTPGPVSKLPAEMLGKWVKGSFNMINFFTYDGKDLGRGYESSRALSFTPDGQVEMFLYFHTYDGFCRSHAFTYIKGEATVEGNVLHIKAQSGKYRGTYSLSCGFTDFARDMTPEEVEKSVYKFYWSRQSDNGKEYLVTKFEPDASDAASDFWVKTDW